MHPSIGLFIKLFYVILKLTNLYKDREREKTCRKEKSQTPPPNIKMPLPLIIKWPVPYCGHT